MSKFWTLVIMKDLSMNRAWVNHEFIVSFLTEQKGKIYRSDNSQEAVLSDGKILWKDVMEMKIDEQKVS